MFDDVDWKELFEFLLVLAIGLLIGALAVKATEDDGFEPGFTPVKLVPKPKDQIVFYYVEEGDGPENPTRARLDTGFRVIEPTKHYGACDAIMGDTGECPSRAIDLKGGNRL